MNCTIRCRRNDLCFTRHQAAENANLLRIPEAFAQLPRYFAPLQGRNAKRCPPTRAGTENLLNTIRASPIVYISERSRGVQNVCGHSTALPAFFPQLPLT